MKQIYIQPQTKVEHAQCEMLLAASIFDQNSGSQSITPTDDEYNGEFAAKEFLWDDSDDLE